ncbi:MAG: ABC transporter ATP-binding protein [Planctomycetaceae bacterium]|nr:ABC transporter ATP-binding protein [Planctomycetaceae bacterium]
MSDHVIEIKHLSRRFRRTTALDDVSLEVPAGIVMGLVGGNGAGKTTLIKHLLGLLKAKSGSVRVFGLDPVRDPVGVLGRIGYLSEDRDLPQWMRVDELLNFTQAYFPNWDPAYAAELRETFDLDPKQRIKSLSRGQTARLGLLTALAHRPPLLVLDEPSSGLDAVVRRDILAAIIRTVADEGRTVLFSSHLLDEVERVADRVAMLHNGQLVLSDQLQTVLDSHSRLTLRFAEPSQTKPTLPGALSCDGSGQEWTVICNGQIDELRAAATEQGAEVVEHAKPSLDEVFVARIHDGGSRSIDADQEVNP